MPRVIGIFQDQSAANAVIEQLELNGIDRTALLGVASETDESAVRVQELSSLRLPAEQAAEYRARLERSQCLLLIEAGALELPTVQRLLRNGQVVDIDVLPESGT